MKGLLSTGLCCLVFMESGECIDDFSTLHIFGIWKSVKWESPHPARRKLFIPVFLLLCLVYVARRKARVILKMKQPTSGNGHVPKLVSMPVWFQNCFVFSLALFFPVSVTILSHNGNINGKWGNKKIFPKKHFLMEFWQMWDHFIIVIWQKYLL